MLNVDCDKIIGEALLLLPYENEKWDSQLLLHWGVPGAVTLRGTCDVSSGESGKVPFWVTLSRILWLGWPELRNGIGVL